jgi:lichenan operon transcriptional antiterminator
MAESQHGACAALSRHTGATTGRDEGQVAMDRHERLVARLRAAGTWVSAADLAAELGVTTRSVRNYVTALNDARGSGFVETSHRGYRLGTAAPSGPTAVVPLSQPAKALQTPERLHLVLRELVSARNAVDVHQLAESLKVSSSTIESDLGRARALLPQYRLGLIRDRESVHIEGAEVDKRRLIRHTLTQASTQTRLLQLDAVQAAYPSYDIAELKRVVQQTLSRHSLEVNEYAINTLVLHLVITIDRITEDRTVTTSPVDAAPDDRINGAVRDLVRYAETQYGVEVDPRETEALVAVVASKSTLNLGDGVDSDAVVSAVGERYVALVRRICKELSEHYLVDIEDEALVAGLGLHIRNLVVRASAGRPVSNPLAAQIKQAHPLVHELAIYFAQHVELALDLPVSKDEIGFFALHIGGCLERQRERMDQTSVALVVPKYYRLHEDQSQALVESLGDRARVVATYTSAEQDWSRVNADLVITPVEIPQLHPARQVVVSPLLTQHDLDTIHQAVQVARRRSSWLRAVHQLRQLVDRQLFFSSGPWHGRDEVITHLVAAMQEEGVVGDAFLDQVLEREAMSPTSFSKGLAVPHAMTMEAHRSAIAVYICDEPIDWGGYEVKLVLLVAFNAGERRLFREVFDQMIVTLSESSRVQRLAIAGTDYETFIADLMDLMDV